MHHVAQQAHREDTVVTVGVGKSWAFAVVVGRRVKRSRSHLSASEARWTKSNWQLALEEVRTRAIPRGLVSFIHG